MFIFKLQKLLLLPELGDTTLTCSTTSPIKINSIRHAGPAFSLANEELNSNECELSSNEVTSSKVSVSGLSASWTH